MDNTQQPARGGFTRILPRLLLLAVFLVLLARLLGFTVAVGKTSLQMDFSSFYAAGQAVSRGLSPYVNHVEQDPPIWDGVDGFRHSRFLYPPLAARLFQPFTVVPYPAAKFIWNLLSLIALAAGIAIALRHLRLRPTPANLLVSGIVTVGFYPVLTLLERGQLDAFTLLLIVGAVALLDGRRSSLVSGLLLSVATLLKLQCVFLLPFLLVRRRWRAVTGFVAGGLILLTLDVAIDGPHRVRDYAFQELPRISRYGEGGTRTMSLPTERFRAILQGVEPGRTVMDGREYEPSYFRFVLNATLAQKPVGTAVRSLARGIGLAPGQSHLALFFLVLGFALIHGWRRWCGPVAEIHRTAAEFVYWQLVMVLILLCGPITWAMNTVWLLPMTAIVLRELPHAMSRARIAALSACVLGLILVGMPDPYDNAVLRVFGKSWLDQKYILGELLCFAGLLGLWRCHRVGVGEKEEPRSPLNHGPTHGG